MEIKQIAHDITLIILQNKVADQSPEQLVTTYFETLQKVTDAVIQYKQDNRPKARVISRDTMP